MFFSTEFMSALFEQFEHLLSPIELKLNKQLHDTHIS